MNKGIFKRTVAAFLAFLMIPQTTVFAATDTVMNSDSVRSNVVTSDNYKDNLYINDSEYDADELIIPIYVVDESYADNVDYNDSSDWIELLETKMESQYDASSDKTSQEYISATKDLYNMIIEREDWSALDDALNEYLSSDDNISSRYIDEIISSSHFDILKDSINNYNTPFDISVVKQNHILLNYVITNDYDIWVDDNICYRVYKVEPIFAELDAFYGTIDDLYIGQVIPTNSMIYQLDNSSALFCVNGGFNDNEYPNLMGHLVTESGQLSADLDTNDCWWSGISGDIVNANLAVVTLSDSYENREILYYKVVDIINDDVWHDKYLSENGNTDFSLYKWNDIHTWEQFVETLSFESSYDYYNDRIIFLQPVFDAVHYVDYFTNEVIYIDVDYDDGVIYENDDYAVWINENTGKKLDASELTGGLFVYGIPKELDATIVDEVDWNEEDTKWKLSDDSDLTDLSKIKYELVRPDEFNEVDYPILDVTGHIYHNCVIEAQVLKPIYTNIVYAIRQSYDATIYEGDTGNEFIPQNSVKWELTEIGGKEIGSTNYYGSDISASQIKYTISISDVDKLSVPYLFSAHVKYAYSNVFGYSEVPTITHEQLVYNQYFVTNLISANASLTNPTCVDKGAITYSIPYDFSNTLYVYFVKNELYDFESSSNDYSWEYVAMDTNITSSFWSETCQGTDVSNILYLTLSTIDSFDDFANPYLLETYGMKHYESLYVVGSWDMWFEFYPTYNDDGSLTYYLCYNDDFDSKSDDETWNNILIFNNDEDGIAAYNEWVQTLPVDDKGQPHIPFKLYWSEYIMIANRNNPNNSTNIYDSIVFNLTGDIDADTVPSVFFKSDDVDGIYLNTVLLSSDSGYEKTEEVDELGHTWNDDWQHVDVENIANNIDIININNAVIDVATLIANADNSGDIDVSLLNDSNNKLRYRICSRMQDAYELDIYHEHHYGEPTFIWSEDGDDADDLPDCTAEFECTSSDDLKSFKCDVTKRVVDADCVNPGTTTYTASVVFNGKTYTDTKEVALGELGHIFESNWIMIDINDVSSYAAITAINNNVIDLATLLSNAENEVDGALLSDTNNVLYYRICTRNTDAYELKISHIHHYGQPTFDWNDDYTECIAIFECTSGDDTIREVCSITTTTIDAKCTVDGSDTHIATVVFHGITYTDTKVVVLPQLGHTYGEWYIVTHPTYHNTGLEQRDCIRNDDTQVRDIDKLNKVAVVDGYVKDDNGNPLANFKVELHSEPRYTYTDANGYFKFEDVEMGAHMLVLFDTTDNKICEFAINVELDESDVNDNYVSDDFDWDSTIDESNVSFNIDGIKVTPPFIGSPETGVDTYGSVYLLLYSLCLTSGLLTLFIRRKVNKK